MDKIQQIGRERQAEVYLGGVAGKSPSIPVRHDTLFKEAGKKMSKEAFAYICGGAGLETTMRSNRKAFKHYEIIPRMLRDVSERNMETELFGKTLPSPFLLSPIGVLEMVHPDADLAVAKAAAQEEVPFIFSNQASVHMETCADVMGKSPRWFQLYWSKSDEVVKSFVNRAEKCGCDAIVVTLDTTLLGWRARDLESTYLPFLRAQGMAQYLSDPVFMKEAGNTELPDEKRTINLSSLKAIRQMLKKVEGSSLSHLKSKIPMKAVRHFIETYSRPSLTWEDLSWLRDVTSLPIVLKGIQHPEDARKAIDYGMDGIFVSNHGGRQVDGAVGSLDALAAVTKEVGSEIPVLFDSGIRCGADVFKALALGADAVGIGRPYVYALTLKGEQGVRELIRNYKADLDLTMGLSGCRDLSEVNRASLRI